MVCSYLYTLVSVKERHIQIEENMAAGEVEIKTTYQTSGDLSATNLVAKGMP